MVHDFLIKQNDRIYINKGWGGEDWIYNEQYCGKRLFFHKGKCCSWHKHIKKDEVLFCLYGLFLFRYSWEEDKKTANTIIFHPGEALHIPPGLIHQMCAYEESMIFEISTHHEDNDSIRIEKGD